MTKFSASLAFLWADRPLPDAIRAAGAAGFDAVESTGPTMSRQRMWLRRWPKPDSRC